MYYYSWCQTLLALCMVRLYADSNTPLVIWRWSVYLITLPGMLSRPIRTQYQVHILILVTDHCLVWWKVDIHVHVWYELQGQLTSQVDWSSRGQANKPLMGRLSFLPTEHLDLLVSMRIPLYHQRLRINNFNFLTITEH